MIIYCLDCGFPYNEIESVEDLLDCTGKLTCIDGCVSENIYFQTDSISDYEFLKEMQIKHPKISIIFRSHN